MKNLYLLIVCTIFTLSCTNDNEESQVPKTNLKACFTFENDIGGISDRVKISNCSVDAFTYDYKVSDNGLNIDNVREPDVFLSKVGEFEVTLTVRDRYGNMDSVTKTITVIDPEDYYYFPPRENDRLVFGELGINPINNKFYLFETAFLGHGDGYKTTYKELEDKFEVHKTINIDDFYYYGVNHFIDFLPDGKKHFYLSKLRGNDNDAVMISYDNEGNLLSRTGYLANYSGMIKLEGKNLLYGIKRDAQGIYRATVEATDGNGEILQTVLSEVGDSSSWLTALIPSKKGFVGYGSTFSGSGTSNIKLLNSFIVFYDNDLNEVSQKILKYSPSNDHIISISQIGEPHFLSELDNGNFVIYFQGELKVLDYTGEELKSIPVSTNLIYGRQALYSYGDGFIISTNEFLRKYDMDGNEIKKFRYKGDYCYGFVEFQGNLLFSSGILTNSEPTETNGSSTKHLFYFGMVDKDLNLIDITP